MKIHEYQAKKLISNYGVAVPNGQVTTSLDNLEKIYPSLNNPVVVVKAQIHAGGRGKGGGVKLAKSLSELKTYASQILGMQLVTHQTGPNGQKVKTILIEEGLNILKELYCSIIIDRVTQMPILMASTDGGVDIEEIAAKTPEKIHTEFIDPLIGLKNFQAIRLAYNLKLDQIDRSLIVKAARIFKGIYNAFDKEDASLLEINPLLITKEFNMLALDCKMILDDGGLVKHKHNLALIDLDEEDPTEVEASKFDLNYIKLEGNIGCMVNGAGLAMATMDIIKFYGGTPANFLDVGGGATQERVEAALRIICHDKTVDCIFINIFGGIVRCDMIAKGIVEALSNTDITIPIVVRLQGNNSLEAKSIIEQSKFAERLKMVEDLSLAAKEAVAWTK